MRIKYQEHAGAIKIAVMAFLLALSCWLTYYFHFKFAAGTVFTHYFYVPIILACIWWKRRGLVVLAFLAAMLIISHYAFRSHPVTANDYFGAVMLVFVGIVLAILSEWIDRRHKLAEEALRESEKKYRTLFESSVEGVFLMTDVFIDCNEQACRLWACDREDIIGHSPVEFSPPSQPDGRDSAEATRIHIKAAMAGTPQFFYWKIRRKDGSLLDTEVSLKALAVKGETIIQAVIRDISKRRQAEAETARLEVQLRQSAKMEAIGRLAGGIAHDFNNMLAVIQGYADLMLKSMDHDSQHRADVQSIRTAAKRAAALTRQLLAFGRKQTIQPRVMNLNEVIAATDSMLRRIIGEDIELLTIPAKELWNVKIDPSQIEEQVILNLAVNAREAMPDGGKLTIETSNVTLDADYASRHAEVTPGDYVMLAVSDTGTGMTGEVMAHIFEPFFTTKEENKGAGLGLSTTYGIVKQSGGHIWIYSEPGKGTTFKIYLPRVDTPAEHLERKYEPGILPGGTETILVAEDEPSVLAVNCRVLREQGFNVLEAPDGREALRKAEELAGGEIHMLITDVIMPHMNGKDLADRIKTIHPNIKVLYTSGYTDNAIVHHGVLDEGVNFIAKPFPPGQLVRTVRRILDTK